MLTDPLAGAHGATDPALPPVTWHVLSQGQIGATMPLPCPMTEAAAFDAAAAAIAAGRRVRVEKIRRNPQTGGALSICDVTGLLLTGQDLQERGEAVVLTDPVTAHEPDRTAEAQALAEDLRAMVRPMRGSGNLTGLQSGDVLQRWHGRRSLMARLCRLLGLGGGRR